jgi:microcystin-dependent protein
MRVYDQSSAQWIRASSAVASTMILYRFIATAGQTTFTGVDSLGRTLNYVVGNILVYRNGILGDPVSDYTATDGTSVVLASGALVGDEISILAVEPFQIPSVYTKAQSDARYYTQAQVDAAIEATKEALHPVGSFYFTGGNTNPASLLGFGTWTQRAQGLALFGVGTGTDQNAVEKTIAAGANAGEYEHTLTEAELEPHTHVQSSHAHGATSYGIDVSKRTVAEGSDFLVVDDVTLDSGGASTGGATATNQSTGGGDAFNVTPPSFGLYVWERTA